MYVLSGCDLLRAIRGMVFLDLWNYTLKAMRTKGSFPTSIPMWKEGIWGVDMEAGLELLGPANFFIDVVIKCS